MCESGNMYLQHAALRRFWCRAVLILCLHGGVVSQPLLIMQKFRPKFNEFTTIDLFFDDNKRLIFTPQDLHMQNLILRTDW